MKRILVSLMTIALVAALIGGGVYAWFSDPESSTDNAITAGTLDLNVDSGNTAVTTFSVSNKAPDDTGQGSTQLNNVGSLDGELDIAFGTITNTESSGSTEYEADGAPGELGANAEIAVWIDVDESGGWNTDDVGLKSDGTTYTNTGATALDYATIDSYDSDSWDAVVTLTASTGQDDFMIDWRIPNTVGNTIQGDSVSFDITFTLQQPDED